MVDGTEALDIMEKIISRHIRRHMATDFDFQVTHDPSRIADVEHLLTRAHALVADLELELSEFRSTSSVSIFNRAPTGEWIGFSESAFSLLLYSMEISERTQGAFHPLAKSILNKNSLISEYLMIDLQNKLVLKRSASAHLSFGAIGKGCALDQVSRLFERAGFFDYLINAGGSSIIRSGFKDGHSRPWQLAWVWDRDENQDPCGTLLVAKRYSGEKLCLGVSGTLEQGSHILGGTQNMRSVFLVAENATLADALSTALFVGGVESVVCAGSMLKQIPAMALLDENHIPSWNERFQSLFLIPLDWTSVVRSPVAVAGLLVAMLAGWVTPALAQEEAIDLTQMANGFSPYVFDRSDAWIALPALTLLWLLLHLKKTPFKNRRKISLPNEWNKKEQSSEHKI